MVVWVEGYYWVWVVGAIVLVVKCSKWLIVKWLYASSILSWLLAASGPFMCSKRDLRSCQWCWCSHLLRFPCKCALAMFLFDVTSDAPLASIKEPHLNRIKEYLRQVIAH